MARQGGKKSGKVRASTSGFDWSKVTAIALAVTALSGALVAMTATASAASAWDAIPELWDKTSPRKTVQDCPPGWARDVNGLCETKQCPDGSVIPIAEQCPLIVEPFTGPFIVFFDWDKDEIIPAAAAILDIVPLTYQQYDSLAVALAGHADRSGSDDYNIGLSRRRANAVRAYLAARGIPDAAITSEALGESRPLADTADGVREPQNRRVEIVFGPGSRR